MPCRTRMRPPRFRTKDVSTCMGSPTARGSSIRKPFARGGCCLLVSELDRHLGIRPVSQLDTQPVVSPVNASRLPSRAETSCITRGRGGWLGLTPWKTCTSYPLPAFLAHSPLGPSVSCQAHSTDVRFSPNCRHTTALRQPTRCAKDGHRERSNQMRKYASSRSSSNDRSNDFQPSFSRCGQQGQTGNKSATVYSWQQVVRLHSHSPTVVPHPASRRQRQHF